MHGLMTRIDELRLRRSFRRYVGPAMMLLGMEILIAQQITTLFDEEDG